MADKNKNSNHEEFTGNKMMDYNVRQDRHNSDGRLSLETEKGLMTVRNFSVFGLAVESSTEIDLDGILPETKLIFDGDLIGEYALAVKRRSKTPVGWEYGLEVMTETIPVDRIQHLGEIKSAVSSLNERSSYFENLPIEFRCLVQEMGTKLKSLQQTIASFETRHYASKANREATYEIVVNFFGKEIFQILRATNQKLQKLIEVQSEDSLKSAFGYFREVLGDYIYQSPFTKRSFEKPRGYAGDFEMMNQIYRNDDFAQTLFGSCMERAVHLHEEPSAVRNRSSFLGDKIISTTKSTKENVSVLSVACGPAEEVKHAISNLTQEELNRVTFNLLDQDLDALKYAQKNIKEHALAKGKQVKIELLSLGIKEVILKGLGDRKFNLIYSAGLFDYFSDPVATRAGRALGNALHPNGNLVIGNFNITSPNWFGMLSLFDWHLILRSEADLERLFSTKGYAFSIESEPENVNLFCVLVRNK